MYVTNRSDVDGHSRSQEQMKQRYRKKDGDAKSVASLEHTCDEDCLNEVALAMNSPCCDQLGPDILNPEVIQFSNLRLCVPTPGSVRSRAPTRALASACCGHRRRKIDAMRCDAMRCDAMRCDATHHTHDGTARHARRDTTRHDTTRHDTRQHKTTQDDTTQHSIIPINASRGSSQECL